MPALRLLTAHKDGSTETSFSVAIVYRVYPCSANVHERNDDSLVLHMTTVRATKLEFVVYRLIGGWPFHEQEPLRDREGEPSIMEVSRYPHFLVAAGCMGSSMIGHATHTKSRVGKLGGD